jgi:hypothetical protein
MFVISFHPINRMEWNGNLLSHQRLEHYRNLDSENTAIFVEQYENSINGETNEEHIYANYMLNRAKLFLRLLNEFLPNEIHQTITNEGVTALFREYTQFGCSEEEVVHICKIVLYTLTS